MPSDPKRVHQVYQHIQCIKAGDNPLIVGSSDDRHGPFRLNERPWKEVPETTKLAILDDAVDWTGITNRDQAHILLAEIDPGQINDAQRKWLIDMAEVKEPEEHAAEGAAIRGTLRQRLSEAPAQPKPQRPREPEPGHHH